MGLQVTFECANGINKGYMALPPKKKGPGLIILQEWWGINTNIKDIVERFADAGFVTLAPDLYHGEVTAKPDEAERAMMQLSMESTANDLCCAIGFLKKQEAVEPKKIGVMGFCMGGQLALYAASVSQDIDACVDFYGVHPSFFPKFENITCPILGIFGGLDTFVPPDAVRDLEKILDEHHVSHTFITYEQAGHAFFNDTRKEVYNKKAAQDAEKKVIEFLREFL